MNDVQFPAIIYRIDYKLGIEQLELLRVGLDVRANPVGKYVGEFAAFKSHSIYPQDLIDTGNPDNIATFYRKTKLECLIALEEHLLKHLHEIAVQKKVELTKILGNEK